MKQPFSVLTNISYVIAGAFALSTYPVIGISLILLGIASTGYHWRRTRNWQSFDVGMIYIVLMLFAGVYLDFQGWEYISVLLALPLVLSVEKVQSAIVTPILFLVIVLAAYNAGVTPWLYVPIFGMGVLYNVPYLSCTRGCNCIESRPIDITHGVWHLLTGYGFYLLLP
jgi:hypothetical protein